MGVDEGINGALFLFDAMQHMPPAIHLLIKQVDGKSPQFAQRKVGGDVFSLNQMNVFHQSSCDSGVCVRRIQPLTVFLEMVHRLLVGFQEGNDALHHADQMIGI